MARHLRVLLARGRARLCGANHATRDECGYQDQGFEYRAHVQFLSVNRYLIAENRFRSNSILSALCNDAMHARQ